MHIFFKHINIYLYNSHVTQLIKEDGRFIFVMEYVRVPIKTLISYFDINDNMLRNLVIADALIL